MKKPFFRFRPKTKRARVKALARKSLNLMREQRSRINLRQRDQETQARPPKTPRARLLRTERTVTLVRTKGIQGKPWFPEVEQPRQPSVIHWDNQRQRQEICQTRTTRQEVLFAKNIAGKKRSPGKNGTYKRTPDSTVHCEHKL